MNCLGLSVISIILYYIRPTLYYIIYIFCIIILYYIILHYIILYCIVYVLYYIILYYFILYYIILHHIILHYTIFVIVTTIQAFITREFAQHLHLIAFSEMNCLSNV